MKKIFLILSIVSTLALWSCSHNHSDHEGEHGHDHEHEAAEEHDDKGHDHHGDGIIEFSDAEARQFKVTHSTPVMTDIATTATLPGVWTGSNESSVSLTAPKNGILQLRGNITEGSRVKRGQTIATIKAEAVTGGDPDETLRHELKAINAEIERIKPLAAEGIVSRKELIALESQAAQLQNRIATGANAGVIISPVDGIVKTINAASGSFVVTGSPVVTLEGGNRSIVMLRVDLPSRIASDLNKVVWARTADTTMPRATTAANADAGGYVATYFGPAPASMNVTPGTPVEVTIGLADSKKLLTVPSDAIQEQEGVYSLFVKVSPGHYRRIPVTLGETDGTNTAICNGVNATDSVVTQGAVFLRLAETRANAPQGHTHEH